MIIFRQKVKFDPNTGNNMHMGTKLISTGPEDRGKMALVFKSHLARASAMHQHMMMMSQQMIKGADARFSMFVY